MPEVLEEFLRTLSDSEAKEVIEWLTDSLDAADEMIVIIENR